MGKQAAEGYRMDSDSFGGGCQGDVFCKVFVHIGDGFMEGSILPVVTGDKGALAENVAK